MTYASITRRHFELGCVRAIGHIAVGLSFRFRHCGETYLPNWGFTSLILSVRRGETYLPNAAKHIYNPHHCGFRTSFAKFQVSVAIENSAKLARIGIAVQEALSQGLVPVHALPLTWEYTRDTTRLEADPRGMLLSIW
jgi:hypothetical protein